MTVYPARPHRTGFIKMTSPELASKHIATASLVTNLNGVTVKLKLAPFEPSGRHPPPRQRSQWKNGTITAMHGMKTRRRRLLSRKVRRFLLVPCASKSATKRLEAWSSNHAGGGTPAQDE